jgi:Transposase DDE domain
VRFPNTTRTLASPAVGRKSFFGYKAHIAVDQGTDLIRGAILTGADMRDSLVADALIQGDEAVVYADKAYDSQTRRVALAEAGIVDVLVHHRHPRRRQPAWQKWMNVALTPIRCQVERLFGLMKRSYGYHAEDDAKLFLGEAWSDPIEAGIRDRIGGFIEELIEEELAALGRGRYERRQRRGGGEAGPADGPPVAEAADVSPLAGRRHGHRQRRITGSFGTVEIAVPRARIGTADGGTAEWKSRQRLQ